MEETLHLILNGQLLSWSQAMASGGQKLALMVVRRIESSSRGMIHTFADQPLRIFTFFPLVKQQRNVFFEGVLHFPVLSIKQAIIFNSTNRLSQLFFIGLLASFAINLNTFTDIGI